jgi:AcrR family transcriptional regulator
MDRVVGRGRPRDRAIDGAVLDAAEQLLARRGYRAMSIDRVAAAAGVSKPTLYRRYASKEELVAATIDRLRPPLPKTSARAVMPDLVALIETGRQWVDRHGLRIVAAVLLEQVERPELFQRFKERVITPYREAIFEVLRAGIDRGELRSDADRAEVVDALSGSFWAHSLTVDHYERDWSRRLVQALLEGLSAAPTGLDGEGLGLDSS